MVTSRNLFREYILVRSRMVSYVAAALVLFGLLALIALVSSSPLRVNQFGLLLQLVGVLALFPDAIGKERLRIRRLAEPADEGAEVDPDASIPETGSVADTQPLRTEANFNYYQEQNLPFLLGNILASLALMWLLVDFVLVPQVEHFPREALYRGVVGLLGFAWFNLFMVIYAFRLNHNPIPRSLLAFFIAVDFFVGFLGVVFAAVIHILLRWASSIFYFIFHNGVRRVLLIVTLPALTVGLIFEFFATFFK